MASKEDFIIFICGEINCHQKEIERLQEKLGEVRCGKYKDARTSTSVEGEKNGKN